MLLPIAAFVALLVVCLLPLLRVKEILGMRFDG